MDSLTLKVAARHWEKIAETVDVPKLIATWEVALKKAIHEREEELPRMLAAKVIVDGKQSGWEFDPDVKYAYHVYETLIYRYMFFAKSTYDVFQRMGVPHIFFGLLKQYELPAAIRKKVELASRFWMKTRAQRPKREEAVESYQKTKDLYEGQLALAKQALAQASVHAEGGATRVKAGPFTVVNSGGFPQDSFTKCVSVVEKAAHLLQAKGLSKVCYGDVYVTNNINKSRVLAFYLLGKDEMYVRADLKGRETAAVETVLHELGHRLQHMFLKSNNAAIHAIYSNLKLKASLAKYDILKDPEKKPKPGDTLTSKGKTYVVDEILYSRNDYKVTLHLDGKPEQKASVSLAGYIEMKGIKTEGNSGFVSAYAATSPDENFAEMIAHYCMGTLPEDQVTALEALL